MMNDGMMIRQNKDGVWEQYEPYATITVDTEEDYKFMQNAVELAHRMKWIPVTERLPEDFVKVLTCDANGNIHVDSHHHGFKYPFCIFPNDQRRYMPIAWMPLPEPYKEG